MISNKQTNKQTNKTNKTDRETNEQTDTCKQRIHIKERKKNRNLNLRHLIKYYLYTVTFYMYDDIVMYSLFFY